MSNLDEVERLSEIIEENEMAMALMDADLLTAAETVKRWENNYNMQQKSYSDLLAELTKEREAKYRYKIRCDKLIEINGHLCRWISAISKTKIPHGEDEAKVLKRIKAAASFQLKNMPNVEGNEP